MRGRVGGAVSVHRFTRRVPHHPVAATAGGAGRLLAAGRSGQVLAWARSSWVDIVWVAFVAISLAAMRLLPAWQTVPFLAIWVSLTVIYGFRLWRIQPTMVTLAAVTIATGGIIGVQVLKGQQDADYLAEVPLIALMFLVMVWHGRRRLAATEERVAAMEEVQRVSQENLRLLKQQRRFLQDASHELGTPITVALGHAELIERAVTNPVVAEDARVVTDELMRLRRLATRMLLLASAESPDFLQLAPIPVESVVVDALDRWGTRHGAGGWARWPRRSSSATGTASPWRSTPCWRTRWRTPRPATGSGSARALRAWPRCWPCPIPGAASRTPTCSGSSSGSPAPSHIAAGRAAGSGWGWRSCRRSRRRTAARCGRGARPGTAQCSR